MNRTGKLCEKSNQTTAGEQAALADKEIARILAAEDALIPSSGFLAAVMERVETEAAAPPPIPFPWRRGLPGILLATGVSVWGTVELVRLAPTALTAAPLPPMHLFAAYAAPVNSAVWVSFALAVSLLSWLLARRLAGAGGLL